MKKTLFSFFFISISLIAVNIILTSSAAGRATAANSGNTGAPSEPTTCRNCHGSGFGTTVAITVKDTSGSSITEYTPGDTLEVEVKVNHTGRPSKFGFQVVSLNSSNRSVSDWINPSNNTQIATAGNRTYAEHDGKSSSSTFSSQWVAPAKGSGSITFYAGGAAVNNNGSTSGDGGATTSFSLNEKIAASVEELAAQAQLSLFPNPVTYTINAQLANPAKKYTTIEIRDLAGRLVFQKALKAGSQIAQFDVESLQKGQYIAILKEQNELLHQMKFLKL